VIVYNVIACKIRNWVVPEFLLHLCFQWFVSTMPRQSYMLNTVHIYIDMYVVNLSS